MAPCKMAPTKISIKHDWTSNSGLQSAIAQRHPDLEQLHESCTPIKAWAFLRAERVCMAPDAKIHLVWYMLMI